jgi:L-lactate dehydrogenase
MLLVKSSSSKVAIIGAGAVGSSAAYALMLGGVASEIVLIDVRKDKAEGEALDLAHCRQFTDATVISAGDDLSLVKGAAVIVLTAGIGQQPGQSRDDLLPTNVALFKQLVPELVKHNKEAIFLVVTNPLDVMTYVTLQLSGKDACHVFGSGTVLDTARLRFLVGEHFLVSPKDVMLNVLGEHGQDAFACWQSASIAGVPLHAMPTYDSKIMEQLFAKTKEAAGEIIRKKGSTSYAIGLVITKIIRAIIHNQARIFSVSTMVPANFPIKNICLSLPTIIRKSGVCQQMPLHLDAQEHDQLMHSAKKIASEIERAKSFL